MAVEKGWKPMPLAIKLLFAFFIVGVITQFLTLAAVFKSGAFLLGIRPTGFAAIAVLLFITALTVVLLYAIWNRFQWTWKYAIALEGFGMINSFLGVLALPAIMPELVAQAMAENPELYEGITAEAMAEIINASISLSMAITLIVFAIVIAVFYKKRGYFIQ